MVETQTSVFELTGNRLCLDFVNTLNDRLADSPRELLNNYADLVLWSQEAQIVTGNDAQQLLAEAARHPRDASAVLERAIVLREAIYHIFLATADHKSPAETDLSLLNAAVAEAMTHACIVPKTEGFSWDWTDKEKALDRMLWQVARSAADLLTSDELDAVRVCAAEDCDWLFLDTSKNHSRRWCDMKSCGNRAKARRHYVKKK
jgi:predicted RNA-binding Zn ribbon-like protein